MKFFKSPKYVYQKIKEGDEKVTEEFYVENFPKIRNYVFKNDRSFSGVEDFYHDMLMIMLKKIRSGEFEYREKDVGAYLMGIAKRKLGQSFRDREKTFHVELSNEPREFIEQYEDEMEDPEEALSQVMQRLDDVCRKLLLMVYYKKLSHDEIAKIVGFKNANTVKSKKNKCINRARKIGSELIPSL